MGSRGSKARCHKKAEIGLAYEHFPMPIPVQFWKLTVPG
jgi:hypothetical protein